MSRRLGLATECLQVGQSLFVLLGPHLRFDLGSEVRFFMRAQPNLGLGDAVLLFLFLDPQLFDGCGSGLFQGFDLGGELLCLLSFALNNRFG